MRKRDGRTEREREKDDRSDTARIDEKERERDGPVKSRARPLNSERSGRTISARTRRPVSIVVGFCELLTDSHRKRVRFAQQRRVSSRHRETDRQTDRQTETTSEAAHTVVAYPRIERLAVG